MADHYVKLKVSSHQWKELRHATRAIDEVMSPRDICQSILTTGLSRIDIEAFAIDFSMKMRRTQLELEEEKRRPPILGPSGNIINDARRQ